MPTGTVKWFNNAKGYGFILPSDSEEDVFAHYSAINMEGYRTLKAGQQVTFDLENGDKGKHAVNIQLGENPGKKNNPPAGEIGQSDSEAPSSDSG